MQKNKILIVEDELLVATDLKESLENIGYNVLDIVTDGCNAISKAKDEMPDIVLMDIMLNGTIDGIDAAKEITRFLDVPVLFLTAYCDDEIKERVKEINPYGYILKPFNFREVEANIDIILNKIHSERKCRDASKFIANISHEMRTALNGILGFVDLLKDKAYTEKEKDTFIDIIENSGEYLLKLVTDIIDISKIESGEFKIKESIHNLNTIIKEIHSFFTIDIIRKNKKNINIEYHCGLDDCNSYLYLDDIRIKQILLNLLSNAVKFTDEGVIEFGYKVKESNIEFFVKDSGIGIKEEETGMIFDRFKQASNRKSKHGGFGLGLMISKKLIEQMKGSIWVESQINKGSIFFFKIPFKPAILQ